MNEDIKLLQNPDGTYSLRGLRFGEESSPKSKPLAVDTNRNSSLAEAPSRQYYGEFKFNSQKGVNSRYDDDLKNIERLDDGYSVDELRGEAQPWYDKIAAGVVKGGVLATTTFVDGIAGTMAGLLNIAANLDKIAESDNPGRELGNQFINNPISATLAKVNELSENILPNYYSKAEQEGPWTDHIFSANFIGDKFLKNLGFTIGAAYSGKVTAGLASKAMGLKGVRDAFKGAVTTASGKVLNTSSEIAKAYKTGDAFMDGVKLTDDLGKAAKKLANAEWKLKTIGAISGAMGEGRIEAINETKQWATLHEKQLEDSKRQQIDNIEYQLFEEHPEWFSMVAVPTGEGVTYKSMITNPEGQAEWERRKVAIENNHTKALEELAKRRADMANVIFAANTAFLSASNMWQYGRFLSGGYTSGRQAKNLVKGSAKEGFTANKAEANKQLVRALSNPFVEMNEEMTQAFFGASSGLKYEADLENFYGAKINPNSEAEIDGWLDAIAQGAKATYGNYDTWEEGALGFMTGLLGIPKIGLKRNSQGKVSGVSVSSEGEFWQGLKEYKNIKKETEDVVNALNARVQSEEFKNYYQGAIRHNKYQNDMEAALEKGDNFEHKNAEHAQLVSDAIMFDKAGRIQDLYDIINEASNITPEDVADIRAAVIDKESGKSLFEGKTDEDVIRHVKKQAEDAKKKVDTYIEISNNLKSLYGDNISSDHLEELTWMLTQINDWENRTSSIIQKLQKAVTSKAREVKDRYGVDINTTLGNLEWMMYHFQEDDNIINRINEIIYDKNLPVEEGRARIEALIKEKEIARNTSGLTLGREIQHIRSKAKHRREELEKRYSRVSSRLDEYTEKAQEEEELENLISEVYSLYNKYTKDNQYDELTGGYDALRSKVLEAYRGFKQKYGNIPESLEAIEEYLYKEVMIPLSVLEGKRGQSTWEKNRESKARMRQQETSKNLFSQIIALKDMLTSEEMQTLNPLDAKNLSDDLMDLVKLYSARSKFIAKYTQLAENPELFTEEAQKAVDAALKNIQDKEVAKQLEGITKDTTVKELKKKLSEVNPEVKNRIISTLKDSEDEGIKSLANNFEELNESQEVIEDIINGKLKTPEVLSSYNIIKDAFDNANTLEEAKLIIADAISKIDKNVSDALVDIMDKYTDNIQSRKSNKKDKNKAKKKLKKKGLDAIADDSEDTAPEESKKPTRSILDRAGKDTNEPDELQKEEKRESRRKATKDESLKAADIEELTNIVRGKAVLEGTEDSEKDREVVKELAKRELDIRVNPLIHSDDDEPTVGNSEVNAVPTREDSSQGYLRSWAVTQYGFDALKDENKRQAVRYNDPRVAELIKLGAFDFVDSGKLGELFQDNKEIPIHYISVSEGPLSGTILLAIEVTKDVVPLNAITAQDNKRYQVVGTLGFDGKNKKSQRSYNRIKNHLEDERGDNTSKYYVSSMTNKIRHIYSGRIVKSTEDIPVSKRPLKVVLNGESPILGVYYKAGDFRAPRLGKQDIVVPLNTNNSNPREGSLWLMTKEADGRYYAKHVEIGRFDSSYDLDGNRNTPLIQRIIDDVKDILDPNKSDTERAKAKFDLEEVLYFPEGTSILFKKMPNSDEVIVSIEGYENNIGEGLDIEEKTEEILRTLYSDDLGLRFQVSPSKIADSDYIQDLLDSNILYTDLLWVHNVNASFDLYDQNVETGEVIEDKEPSIGHTGNIVKLPRNTILHNGSTYTIKEDGVYKGDKKITNQNTIDEVLFVSKIKAGAINPVDGNPRLFVGTYSNGEKFGIVNYKVKKGKVLQELLDKAKKTAEKDSREDIMDVLFSAKELNKKRKKNSSEAVPSDLFISEEGDKETGIVPDNTSFFDLTVIDDENDSSDDELFVPAEDYTEEEQSDSDDLFLSADDSREEEEEEILPEEKKKTVKPKKSIIDIASEKQDKEVSMSKQGPSLSLDFNPNDALSADELQSDKKDFNSLLFENESMVKTTLGVDNIISVYELLDNTEDIPNIDSIDTQEKFKAFIDTLKCHMK